MVDEPALEELELTFPRAGARARRWKRFERDYLAWLGEPEGRFALWCAQCEPASAGLEHGAQERPQPALVATAVQASPQA